jgi:hypothetical protein
MKMALQSYLVHTVRANICSPSQEEGALSKIIWLLTWFSKLPNLRKTSRFRKSKLRITSKESSKWSLKKLKNQIHQKRRKHLDPWPLYLAHFKRLSSLSTLWDRVPARTKSIRKCQGSCLLIPSLNQIKILSLCKRKERNCRLIARHSYHQTIHVLWMNLLSRYKHHFKKLKMKIWKLLSQSYLLKLKCLLRPVLNLKSFKKGQEQGLPEACLGHIVPTRIHKRRLPTQTKKSRNNLSIQKSF